MFDTMEESEENDVVSSSSSSSSSSPQSSNSKNSHSRSCPDLCAPGTAVSLRGKMLWEMENAFFVSVDWKGENFAGSFIQVDDINCWQPKKLIKYPSLPKKKICKTPKTVNSNSRGKNPRPRGMYSTKYPRSFVDTSNIVQSKLRYGRDKKVASYSSCPSIPKGPEPVADVFNSNVSDINAIPSTNGFSLSRSKSANLVKCSDPPLDSPKRNVSRRTVVDETQCNEIGSTGLGDHSVDEFGIKYNLNETDDRPMPSLSKEIICSEEAETTTENLSSNMYFNRKYDFMPSLVPLETNFNEISKLNDACSAERSLECSVITKTTDIKLDPSIVSFEQSTQHQGAAPNSTLWKIYDEIGDSGKTSLPIIDSDSEKTFTILENCDINYLQLPSPAATTTMSLASTQFPYTPSPTEEETVDDSFLHRDQPIDQAQNANLGNASQIAHNYVERPD